MSQSTGESGNPNHADARTDPAMKALYHMSRTAGVGLGDYAAVNVLSVVGLIVGIACFVLLVFDDSLVLLALPLGAIIVCTIAIAQIRGSNGTQVGTLLAVAGALLACAFGVANIVSHLKRASIESEDRAQIEKLVNKLAGSATTQATVPASYELFHPRFRESVIPDTFTRTVVERTGLAAGMPVAGISLGKYVLYEKNPGLKFTQASALIVLKSERKDEKGEPLTRETQAIFRREADGIWTIYSIPEWFGEAQQQSQPGQRQR